ncbi:MAG: cytochrome c family protein [Alphaproteobacteria bacterium]|nr:MAG: cytochrome c family protein [Alphaproteobacteria bacterium]
MRSAQKILSVLALAGLTLACGLAAPAGAAPAPGPAANNADGRVAVPRTISSRGDPERGRKIFYRCQSCHRIAPQASPLLGPNLGRLFGRRAGSLPGYAGYSRALREAGFIWTEERLDAWLKDPAGFLPGNRMPFAGVRSARDRADLIAYLRSVQDRLEAQDGHKRGHGQ